MGINHTPGPWIVYGAPGNVWAPFDQKNLANAYIADRDRETQAANARLIAEAPAMLEALRETLRDLDAVTGVDDHGSDTIGCMENRIRAILSRIDGAPTAQPAAPISEAAPAQTFTAFCQEADETGTIWIQQVKAEAIADAVAAARRDCAEDWGFDVEHVHCLGLAQGDCEIVHWEDADA